MRQTMGAKQALLKPMRMSQDKFLSWEVAAVDHELHTDPHVNIVKLESIIDTWLKKTGV